MPGTWTPSTGSARSSRGVRRPDAASVSRRSSVGFAVTYTGKHLTGRRDIRGPAQFPAAQLLVATAALSLVVVPQGDAPTDVPLDVVMAMLGLGVLGTGLAYVLLYRVVALAGATTASTVTYLIPLVSTTLGIVVLGEALTWNEPAGAVLVLLGAWLTRPRARTDAPVQTPHLPETRPA